MAVLNDPNATADLLPELGVMALLAEVHGTARQREMVPYVQDCLALWAEDLVRH